MNGPAERRPGGHADPEGGVFRNILLVQGDPTLHLFTCGNCSRPERDAFPLVPWVTEGGTYELRCPLNCGWRQPVDEIIARVARDGAKIVRRGGMQVAMKQAAKELGL